MRTNREWLVLDPVVFYIVGVVALVPAVVTKAKGFFTWIFLVSIALGVVLQVNAPQ